MKKAVVGAVVMAMGFCSQVQADQGLDVWSGAVTAAGPISVGVPSQRSSETSEYSPWKGAGLGALVGAVVSGPPGFVLGAAGGGLVDHVSNLVSDNNRIRQQLQQAEQQRVLVQELNNTHDRQMRGLINKVGQLQKNQTQQLQAIADGFVIRFQFRTGSAVLSATDETVLDQLAQALQHLPGLTLHIHAGADRRGSKRDNKKLSWHRAESLRQFLVKRGVDARSIQIQADGEQMADYSEEDIEGLAMDRQAVIRFCYKERV